MGQPRLVSLAKARCPLENASFTAQNFAQRPELRLPGIGPGNRASIRCGVGIGPGGRYPQRPGTQCIRQQRLHLLEFPGIGVPIRVDGIVTQNVDPGRRMPHETGHVDALRGVVDGSQVFAERLPVERQRGIDRLNRDLFHRFQRAGQGIALFGPHRCIGDAAVADECRGDAVPAHRAGIGVPEQLGIEMCVGINEARRYQPICGVNFAPGRLGQGPNLHNPVAANADVGSPGVGAGPIHQRTVSDRNVIHGVTFLLIRALIQGLIQAGAEPDSTPMMHQSESAWNRQSSMCQRDAGAGIERTVSPPAGQPRDRASRQTSPGIRRIRPRSPYRR